MDKERIIDKCIEMISSYRPADISILKEKEECINWLEEQKIAKMSD